ncbi:MAG TPA: glycine--tRNA ligase subunit beta, partial [Planctomycetota bacterium]|nr:glycine--tRNA ligase subunit beta [Planctomycetota bacterium]
EFPELQGRVGEHYARLDGEPAGAAAALAGQYLPRGEWDPVLDDDAAAAVSLAEKADSLAAYFSIDEGPTGTADPFGLRRHALGLLRILAKKEWPISIEAALRPACDAWRLLPPAREALHAFVWGRADQIARTWGFTDFVDAVGTMTARPYFEYRLRLLALRELSGRKSWRDLVALVERTGNMGAATGRTVGPALPPEAAALRDAIDSFEPGEEPVKFAVRYLEVFGPRVARLFEKVLVEDPKDPERSRAIKHLLHEVHALFADRLGDLRRLGSGAKPPSPGSASRREPD